MKFVVARSIVLFIVAGLFEIGGGYLIWLWLRRDQSWLLGACGAVILALYGVIPTLQPSIIHQSHSGFSRVYAAYGAIFIVMSMLWGWTFDHRRPDSADLVGATLCCLGMAMIMYWPRS